MKNHATPIPVLVSACTAGYNPLPIMQFSMAVIVNLLCNDCTFQLMVAGQSGLLMEHVVSLVVEVLHFGSGPVTIQSLNMVAVIVRVKKWIAGPVILNSVQVRNFTTYTVFAMEYSMIQ